MEDLINLDLDTSIDKSVELDVKLPRGRHKKESIVDMTELSQNNEEPIIACLRKEVITVRFIPRESGMITNPKHIFYGGMGDTVTRTFTVPILTNGLYKNVLTKNEKAYLEEVMGLEYNALSIYKRENNFWENFFVSLNKTDNFLDLSNPTDYIKYKVLLANSDFIAPSLKDLADYPKASYQFVIIAEEEEVKRSKLSLNSTMEAYMEFGKIKDEPDMLRVIVEILDGKPCSANTKLEFLLIQADKFIKSNSKLFLSTLRDPYLKTKVLIKKAIEGGLIYKKGDYFYLKEDNTPLCEINEEPTITMAAKYLNAPKRQELRMTLEAKLKG